MSKMDFNGFVRWQRDFDNPSLGILDGVRSFMSNVVKFTGSRQQTIEELPSHGKDMDTNNQGIKHHAVDQDSFMDASELRGRPSQELQRECSQVSRSSSRCDMEQSSPTRTRSYGAPNMSRLEHRALSIKKMRRLEGC